LGYKSSKEHNEMPDVGVEVSFEASDGGMLWAEMLLPGGMLCACFARVFVQLKIGLWHIGVIHLTSVELISAAAVRSRHLRHGAVAASSIR
jgi:hypothetical protein